MIPSYGDTPVKLELQEGEIDQQQTQGVAVPAIGGAVVFRNAIQNGENVYNNSNTQPWNASFGQQQANNMVPMFNAHYQIHQMNAIPKTESFMTSANSNSNIYGKGKKTSGLRRGKWTTEEEAYANRLIMEFKNGLLPLADGTTLRTYLSRLLNCDPMRISKKFVGNNCIGKQVFRRRQSEMDRLTDDDIKRSCCEIADLERQFLERVAQTNKCKGNSPGLMGNKSPYFTGIPMSMISNVPTIGSGVYHTDNLTAPPWLLPPKFKNGGAHSSESEQDIMKDDNDSCEKDAALGLEMLGSGDLNSMNKDYSWLHHQDDICTNDEEINADIHQEHGNESSLGFSTRNTSVENFMSLVESGDISPPKTDHFTPVWLGQKAGIEEPNSKKPKIDISDDICMSQDEEDTLHEEQLFENIIPSFSSRTMANSDEAKSE